MSENNNINSKEKLEIIESNTTKDSKIYILVDIIGAKLFSLTYFIESSDIKVNDIVNVTLKNKEVLGIVRQILDSKNYNFKVLEATKSTSYLTHLQHTLLAFMSKYYLVNIGVCASLFTLRDSNFVKKAESNNKMEQKLENIESNLKTLSQQQEIIFNEALKKNLSLIFGATGSGKTEIYFHLINETLKQNKEVLLLMPEISLTPQMKRRLEFAFPNINEIWHSKKSAKKKREILESLQNKKIKIIAGARSALFLPYQNLGLIIVDEEHDNSYKSNSNPKYNARDLSVFLSTKGVKVVLGSATPSVKSYYLANLHHYLLNLDSKYFSSKQQIIYDNAKNLESSQVIINEIINALNSKKQSIIFVPTRANFKILLCRNCGAKFTCPNCAISLSVHNKTHSLLCHYCNFSREIPNVCEMCGSDDLSGMRFGTEEIKKQLQNMLLFYNLTPNIAIFDRDNVGTEKKLESILNDFNSHKIDILIGTQMIAKGHDYHNVALSVILGVDFMLNMPQFSAIEETFSLIFQVIGRAGRKESGKSIIQSANGAFINSMISDFRLVLEYEINARYPLYPPFTRLALITFTHKSEEVAKNMSYEFANILSVIISEFVSLESKLDSKDSKDTAEFIESKVENGKSSKLDYKIIESRIKNEKCSKILESKVEIVGISASLIPKIKNKFYYQILLRSKENLAIQKLLHHALKRAPTPLLQHLDINIDPLDI